MHTPPLLLLQERSCCFPEGPPWPLRVLAWLSNSRAPLEEGRLRGNSCLQFPFSLVLCGPRQVFGKGNMVFWIIFSVIHIISTLLLSIQLYYMGRWKLGEGMSREGHGESTCRAPWSEGLALRAWVTGDL